MSTPSALFDRLLGAFGAVSFVIFGAIFIIAGYGLVLAARILFWPAFVLMFAANGLLLAMAQLCGFLGGVAGYGRRRPVAKAEKAEP